MSDNVNSGRYILENSQKFKDNNIIKFMHISDSHLGYNHNSFTINKETKRNFKLEDLYKNFDYCISKAIEFEVDFIIHTGDLFHVSRPNYQVILTCMKILEKLTSTNIKFIVIAGNHDRSYSYGSSSPVEFLNYVPNIYPISRYNLIDLSIKGKVVRIMGIAYQSKSPEENILELIKDSYENKDIQIADYSILMLHQTLTSGSRGSEFYTEDTPVIERNLPTDFDYIACGHLHKKQHFSHPLKNDLPIAYAGSTDKITFDERNETKIAWLGILEEGRCKLSQFIIPCRKIAGKKIILDNPTSEKLQNQLVGAINEINNKNAFIGLQLEGELSQTLIQHLSVHKLKRIFKEQVALTIKREKLTLLGLHGEKLTFGTKWINTDEKELELAIEDMENQTNIKKKTLIELGTEIILEYREK